MDADKRRLKIQNDSFHFQLGFAEIDQQANAQSRGLEVIQALRTMNIIQYRNCLELDDYAAFNEQVYRVLAYTAWPS